MPDTLARTILHCDCNNYFASVELLDRPELRELPVAVAGDPEGRHGIILAKNMIAKKAGVVTAEPIWQAKRKCPGLILLPPHHEKYEALNKRINAIYLEITDQVEAFSIDESWLDVTGSRMLFGNGVEIADLLRRRVREETGVTISVGVSDNKTWAKMGSDYRKPDATTEITRENYKDILWPLPVSELLYAGKATVEILKKKNIHTIGDLAACTKMYMHDLLGKGGDQLWTFANGLDEEPVRLFGDREEVKSISKGKTFSHDLITEVEVKTGIAALVDDIAMQLRRQGLKGSVVQVQIKTPQLTTISRQLKLEHYTCLQHEILEVALELIKANWNIGTIAPIRALTVGVTGLLPADQVVEQLSMFDFRDGAEKTDRSKQEKLEATVDLLRQKHGDGTITLGIQKNEDIGL